MGISNQPEDQWICPSGYKLETVAKVYKLIDGLVYNAEDKRCTGTDPRSAD